MSKKNYWIIYTPVVELSYMYLLKPDKGFDDVGSYKAEFLLSENQFQQLANNIESDPRSKINNKQMRLKGTKVDGKIKLRAKQKSVITWKDSASGNVETKEVQPKVLQLVNGETVDYAGNWPLPGSTGELELEVVPYTQQGGGISLRLRGVRFHTVKEGENREFGGSAAFDQEDLPADSGSDSDDDDQPEVGDDRAW